MRSKWQWESINILTREKGEDCTAAAKTRTTGGALNQSNFQRIVVRRLKNHSNYFENNKSGYTTFHLGF